MPIFEYLCKDCGKAFERIVPRYDSSVDCAHCNSANVEKQLSVFAVAGSSASAAEDFAPPDGSCGRGGAAQPAPSALVWDCSGVIAVPSPWSSPSRPGA